MDFGNYKRFVLFVKNISFLVCWLERKGRWYQIEGRIEGRLVWIRGQREYLCGWWILLVRKQFRFFLNDENSNQIFEKVLFFISRELFFKIIENVLFCFFILKIYEYLFYL